MKKIYEKVNKTFKEHYKDIFMLQALLFICFMGFKYIFSLVKSIDIKFGILLLGIICSGPIIYGVTKQLIHLYRNEKYNILSFVKYALEDFLKILKLTFKILLRWIVVIFLVIQILNLTGITGKFLSEIKASIGDNVTSENGLVAVLTITMTPLMLGIGFFQEILLDFFVQMLCFITLVLSVFLSLKYTFVYNEFIYSCDEKKAIKDTIKNMDGNKTLFFNFKINFMIIIGIIIASILKFNNLVFNIGIGIITFFTLLPYIQITYIALYDEIRTKNIANKIDESQNIKKENDNEKI